MKRWDKSQVQSQCVGGWYSKEWGGEVQKSTRGKVFA